jgi:hypothetical protein
MIEAAFFDIFGIFVFAVLLCIGLRFSKYKIKEIKWGGYFLIVIGALGLMVDSYNVIYNYLLR